MAKNGVQRRDDLRITPLLMVDGRQPLFGSDRTMAVAAIEQALKMPPRSPSTSSMFRVPVEHSVASKHKFFGRKFTCRATHHCVRPSGESRTGTTVHEY